MINFLRLQAVRERTGLGRSTIYALISQGNFPAPISLGARAVGWNSESIDAWILSRIAQRRPAEKHSEISSISSQSKSPDSWGARA